MTRLLALLTLIILGAAGCGAPPDERQVRQFLGLEATFAHNDVPPPPSPHAYVRQLGLSQAQRIVVHAGPGRARYEVTDPQTISAVIAVLRAGAQAAAPAVAKAPQHPIRLDLVAGPPERVVTAHYNPGSQLLQLYNVPTAAWPDHAVGSYAVSPAFGEALRAALEGHGAGDPPQEEVPF